MTTTAPKFRTAAELLERLTRDPPAQLAFCFLCGGEREFLLAFHPRDLRPYRRPGSNGNAFIFGLCRTCYELPDALDRVGLKFLAHGPNGGEA
jgi:hypothetical protein